MKRLVPVVMVLLILATAVVLALAIAHGMRVNPRGPDGARFSVEGWAAARLASLASDALGRDLSFDRIEFRAPDVLQIDGMVLRDRGLVFLRAEHLRLRLAETPRPGTPLRLAEGAVRGLLIILADAADGGLVGFGAPRSDHVDADERRTRLGEALRIERLAVEDAEIHWQPGTPREHRLGGITFELTASREQASPGRHRFVTTFGRAPQITGRAEGTIDLDDFVVESEQLAVEIELTPATAASLPDSIRRVLSDPAPTGRVTVTGAGRVDPSEPLAGPFACAVGLDSVHARVGDVRLEPLDGALALRVEGGGVLLDAMDLAVFDGRVSGHGRLERLRSDQGRDTPLRMDGMVRVESIRLERLLTPGAAADAGGPAGAFSGELAVRRDPAEASGDGVAATRFTGTGVVRMQGGRLVGIPIVSGLVRAIGAGVAPGAAGDTGEADVSIDDGIIRLRGIAYTGAGISARGEGEVSTDGRIDFRLNAGPLEYVQDRSGLLGQVIGAVTDRLMKYHVQGTYAEPTVVVRPFGIGADSAIDG